MEARGKYCGPDYLGQSHRRTDNPTLQKGLDALTSSFNYIGGTISNALGEGITHIENRTTDIIQETRKHTRKKPSSSESQNQAQNSQSQMQTDLKLQLNASSDVRWQLCISSFYGTNVFI